MEGEKREKVILQGGRVRDEWGLLGKKEKLANVNRGGMERRLCWWTFLILRKRFCIEHTFFLVETWKSGK